MKRITYILFIFCLISKASFAYTDSHSKIDSIQNQIDNTYGRKKLNNLLELGRAHWDLNPPHAIQLSLQALALAKNLDYNEEVAKGLYYLGCSYHVNNQLDLSLEYLYDAYQFSKSHNFNRIKGETSLRLGTVYYELGKYQKSFEAAKEANAIFNKLYNKRGIIRSLNLIGLYHKSQNSDDLAAGYLDEALRSAKNLKDRELISTILNDLGNYHANKGNILEAIRIYKEAVSYHQDNSQNVNVALFELNLAMLYLKHNEDKKARIHLDRGYAISESLNSHSLFSTYYDFLSQYYSKEKKYESALNAYQKSQAHKDSLNQSQQNNKITDIEVRQALRVKDLENQNLIKQNQDKDIKIFQQYTIGLSLFVALSIAFFILFVRIRNNKKQSEILQLEKSMANQHAQEIFKQKEALQRSEDELKTANETKDKMFSLIAHDLRGSVGNITNGLRMLLSEEDLILTEQESKEFLGSLFHSADNSFELLENLLAWARNQSHSIKANLDMIDMESIILSNLELLSELGKIKSVKIFTITDNKADIFCDRNMIHTVLRNLISNAIKFTNKGGIIEIRTEIREHFVRVSVIDNGVGMRKDQVKNIHKGFTTDGTANEKGTGIGLALCRDFLSKNNGWLNVDSEVDRGSTFTFTVPRRPLSKLRFAELVKEEVSYSLVNI